MSEVRLCFEVAGMARDEDGNPCPAGLQLAIELEHEIEYEKLVKDINIPGVLATACLDSVVKPEDVRVISPAEYDEKYS